MLIEFQNCELVIGHIGTEREIFRSVLRDCAQESIDRFCNKCGIELVIDHEKASGKCMTCMMIEQLEDEATRLDARRG